MQVMHDDDNNITICTALYQSSGFFIIMSPAEGLHFSALVILIIDGRGSLRVTSHPDEVGHQVLILRTVKAQRYMHVYDIIIRVDAL